MSDAGWHEQFCVAIANQLVLSAPMKDSRLVYQDLLSFKVNPNPPPTTVSSAIPGLVAALKSQNGDVRPPTQSLSSLACGHRTCAPCNLSFGNMCFVPPFPVCSLASRQMPEMLCQVQFCGIPQLSVLSRPLPCHLKACATSGTGIITSAFVTAYFTVRSL